MAAALLRSSGSKRFHLATVDLLDARLPADGYEGRGDEATLAIGSHC
jgi:hypothetical protein